MSYVLLKNIHMICVVLTFFSFTLRFVWMIIESRYLQARATRILPHIIDTFLLLSAFALISMLQLNPLSNPWLSAKSGGLLIYIFAGTIALKRGKSKGVRITAGIVAYCTFTYIIVVAFTKNTLIF